MLILGAVLFSTHAQADVLDQARHPVKGCVKILNNNAFVDTVFIGHLTGLSDELYLVEQGKCLKTGYGSDTTEIFLVDRTYLYQQGMATLESKALLKDPIVLASAVAIEKPKRSVWNVDPLIEEEFEYTVTQKADKSLAVYLSKKTSVFNNNRTADVQLFSPPG